MRKTNLKESTQKNTHQSHMYTKNLHGSAHNLAYVHQHESSTMSKFLQLTVHAHTTQIHFTPEKSLTVTDRGIYFTGGQTQFIYLFYQSQS